MKNEKAAKLGLAALFLLVVIPGGKSKSNDITIPFAAPVGSEGSIDESFLNVASAPRGIRNNNLGNMKIGNSAWQGKIPISQNTDGTFEQFDTLAKGNRANIKLLVNYINQGRNTPKKIIQYWDLGNPAYLTFLLNETGFSENQVLQADKATLKALYKAIVKYENGTDFLTDARFDTAYSIL